MLKVYLLVDLKPKTKDKVRRWTEKYRSYHRQNILGLQHEPFPSPFDHFLALRGSLAALVFYLKSLRRTRTHAHSYTHTVTPLYLIV